MRKIVMIAAMAFTMVVSGQKKKPLSADYKYSVSQPYRVIDADNKYYLSSDNRAISVKIDKRDIFVQKFDTETGNQLSVKEYEDAFPKNAVVEDVLFITNKVIVFYALWDGDNKKEQLFAQEIDSEKGEFAGAAKLILKVDGKVSGEFSGRYMDFNKTGKFTIYRSFDKNSFLVKYRRIPEKKSDVKSFDKLGLVAFDAGMGQISNREVTMPYTERRMDNMDFQLDNKGNLYLLNKIYEDDSNKDKKKKSDEVPNYHIELFTLKAGEDAFQISKIDVDGLFINRLGIFDSPNGDMVLAGFYNNNPQKKGFFAKGEYAGFDVNANCDGILISRLKPDGTLTGTKHFEIPTALLNQNESKKTKRKNDKKEAEGVDVKFTDLRSRGIKINPDGSVIFLAEQYYMKQHTSTSMNGTSMSTRTYYTYHYNEVFVARISESGNLDWMKKIPKVQSGASGQGSMGFNYFKYGTDNFLVFFDNPENVEMTDDKAPEPYSDRKKGYLTAVKIADADGAVTRGSILNVKEIEDFKLHQISTDRIVKVSDNSFLMEAYKKGKEDVMVKVVLQ